MKSFFDTNFRRRTLFVLGNLAIVAVIMGGPRAAHTSVLCRTR